MKTWTIPMGLCDMGGGESRRATSHEEAPPCEASVGEPAAPETPRGSFGRDIDDTSGQRVAATLRLDDQRIGGCVCRPTACRGHGEAPVRRPAPAGGIGADIEEAIAVIRADAGIRQAFAAWGSLSVEEKLAIARRIARYLGHAFGFTPRLNMTYDPSLDATGTLGLWTPSGISLSAAAMADPVLFLDTVVHEQIHEYDHQNTAIELAAPDHNSGVMDAVYRIGHAVSGGVLAVA